MDAVVEEKIWFESHSQRLSGVLAYPEQAAVRRAALYCSPHPHFAGNMDNNVITAIAGSQAQDSVVLRFDYRGVGQSQIHLPEGISVFDYWDAIETSKDYADPMEDVDAAFAALRESIENPNLRIVLGGYSFGAAAAIKYGIDRQQGDVFVGIAPPLGKIDFDFLGGCDRPCLLVIGRDDFLYSADTVSKLRSVVNENVIIEELEGCDHFFRGDESVVSDMVRTFISEHTINTESA